jgi:hypothetical protein
MIRQICRSRAFWLAGGTLLLAGVFIGLTPSIWRTTPTESLDAAGQKAHSTQASDELDDQIVAFCSGCHVMPKPSSFPKSRWHEEVNRGFDFYDQSNRQDLVPPPVLAVEEYFRSRAPETLATITSPSAPQSRLMSFRTQGLSLAPSETPAKNPVAVSFISHWQIAGTIQQQVIFSDMANGGINIANPNAAPVDTRRLSQLNNPAVVSRCDLNGNGRIDAVIADLGSFLPADHQLGRVIWLADVDQQDTVQAGVVIAEGLGRVADVQHADFDSDGDIDLIVADFGWHKTGQIVLLRNDGTAAAPKFVRQVIDPRPGTIHVPVVDLNHDGRPDFVALISQEFEVVEAFLNRGDGTFQKETIFSADDPAFGSSGIQIVDLDQDGDVDVVHCNGDMFDSFLIKPYYGVRWLENTGSYPFVSHDLTSFPGVLRALAGDLDHDGDLDIVSTAFLPTSVRTSDPGKKLDSLIWLEQTSPGQFVRHAIENGNCIHAALDLVDLDADGDLDITTGEFRDRDNANGPAATIWWNEQRTR